MEENLFGQKKQFSRFPSRLVPLCLLLLKQLQLACTLITESIQKKKKKMMSQKQ